jgi:hypothetical protein
VAVNNIDLVEISRQLLTFILGLISGVVVSYIVFRYNLALEEKRRKRDIMVQTFQREKDLGLYRVIRATNLGIRPVTLISAAFVTSDMGHWTSGNWQFPKTLVDGELVEYEYEYDPDETFICAYVENSAREVFAIDMKNEPYKF